MRAILEPRFYKILIGTLLVIFGVCIAASWSSVHASKDELAAATAQKRDLEARIVSLQDQLTYAQTDAFIEETARNDLHMLKPGEVLYVAAD